jgi:hypothetical protein
MAQTEQQIEEHVRYLVEKISKLIENDEEGWKSQASDLVLGFGKLLESNGVSRDDICTEAILHFKSVVGPPNPTWSSWESALYKILPRPTMKLKYYKTYETLSSTTAYIDSSVMKKLGMLDTNDDNIIEIEFAGRRTVANVLQLRQVDKRRKNIIRLSDIVEINLTFDLEHNTPALKPGIDVVTVRKAAKAIPADKIMVRPIAPPGYSYPFGGDYLNKKSQGTTIYADGPGFIEVPIPGHDSAFAIFAIDELVWKTEDMQRFGYGGVITVTPETSFEILPNNFKD